MQDLANEFVTRPVRIHVGGSDELVANRDIAQHVRVMPSQAAKLDALYALIEEQRHRLGGDRERERACHTVVFTNRKADAKWLASHVNVSEQSGRGGAYGWPVRVSTTARPLETTHASAGAALRQRVRLANAERCLAGRISR